MSTSPDNLAGVTEDFLRNLAKALADQGKLIEAGWLGMRIAAIPVNAPQAQLDDMRMAFFGGAQHLFGSIMGIMDDDSEPTVGELKRLDAISEELQRFIEAFAKEHGLP